MSFRSRSSVGGKRKKKEVADVEENEEEYRKFLEFLRSNEQEDVNMLVEDVISPNDEFIPEFEMTCSSTIEPPESLELPRPTKKKSKFEFSNNENAMSIVPPAFKPKPVELRPLSFKQQSTFDADLFEKDFKKSSVDSSLRENLRKSRTPADISSLLKSPSANSNISFSTLSSPSYQYSPSYSSSPSHRRPHMPPVPHMPPKMEAFSYRSIFSELQEPPVDFTSSLPTLSQLRRSIDRTGSSMENTSSASVPKSKESEKMVMCPICNEEPILESKLYYHVIKSHSRVLGAISAKCPICDSEETLDFISHLRMRHSGSFASLLASRREAELSLQKKPMEFITRVPRAAVFGGGLGIGSFRDRGKDLSEILWDYVLALDNTTISATHPGYFSSSTTICNGCHGDFQSTDVHALLNCQHVFHADCLPNAMEMPKCPLCKSSKKRKKNKKKKPIKFA